MTATQYNQEQKQNIHTFSRYTSQQGTLKKATRGLRTRLRPFVSNCVSMCVVVYVCVFKPKPCIGDACKSQSMSEDVKCPS